MPPVVLAQVVVDEVLPGHLGGFVKTLLLDIHVVGVEMGF